MALLVLDPWKLQVLASSAAEPVSDGRLRRAQAVSGLDEPGLVLARELIGAKLRGQSAILGSATVAVLRTRSTTRPGPPLAPRESTVSAYPKSPARTGTGIPGPVSP